MPRRCLAKIPGPHRAYETQDGRRLCVYCGRNLSPAPAGSTAPPPSSSSSPLGADGGPSTVPPARTPVHRNPQRTEVTAAARIQPSATTWKGKVYALVRAAGRKGITVAEAHEALGGHEKANLYTVAPRFTELKEDGLIADAGQTRGDRIVWVLPELAGVFGSDENETAAVEAFLARHQKEPA